MARLCHQGGLYLLFGWMGTEGLGGPRLGSTAGGRSV